MVTNALNDATTNALNHDLITNDVVIVQCWILTIVYALSSIRLIWLAYNGIVITHNVAYSNDAITNGLTANDVTRNATWHDLITNSNDARISELIS